ncbi:MAG: TetR/AcrR family transcriptional regulator [Alcanivoracaceae bacterium]|nr:TetR/AcrR family transcriptional regulator [Alcanivoracaceae bacterium]
MTDSSAQVRKRPTQQRARQRYDAILGAAEDLIRTRGTSQFGMNELARAAGVNIASIYQYFAGRPAILRELVSRLSSQYRETMFAVLAQAGSQPLDVLVDGLLDGYLQLVRDEPVYGILWAELRQEPELRDLDIADTRDNATALALALADHFPTLSAERLERIAFLACELSYAVFRLIPALPADQMAELLADYRLLLKAALGNLDPDHS